MARTGLWGNRDFLKLWIGQTVSEAGSRVTREGLPLTAVLVLHATPAQMGFLAALGGLSVLIAGPLAGWAADHCRHRPILICADLGRGLLLATIPVAATMGSLHMWLLYLVASLAGMLTMFFDVVAQTFLPALTGREHLLEGNSKLAASAAAAEIAGPGMTGILVQLFTAPRAILLDSLTFFFSALSIFLIKPVGQASGLSDRPEAHPTAGFGFVARHPLLRPLALREMTLSFSFGIFSSLYVLYAIDTLHVTPATLGMIIATGGAGSLAGSLLARKAADHVPLGLLLIGSTFFSGLMALLIPLARSPLALAVGLLTISQLGDVVFPVYSIHQVTLRQMITPPELLGRVNACMQLLFKGFLPLGALCGGLLAGILGIRPTLVLGAVGVMSSALWLVFSPIRTLKSTN